MKVLNHSVCHEVCGADALTVLGYAGLVGMVFVIAGLEAYLIQHAQDEYEAIDFSTLTPKEAYNLGVSHTYLYCRHFDF